LFGDIGNFLKNAANKVDDCKVTLFLILFQTCKIVPDKIKGDWKTKDTRKEDLFNDIPTGLWSRCPHERVA